MDACLPACLSHLCGGLTVGAAPWLAGVWDVMGATGSEGASHRASAGPGGGAQPRPGRAGGAGLQAGLSWPRPPLLLTCGGGVGWLVGQVLSEFDKYAPALGIKVGLAIGQSDFSKEQASIVGPPPQGSSMRGGEQGQQQGGGGVVGGVSLVDVLVATPGRLMDHLERTAGFTLQHLKYLVIDEVSKPAASCWTTGNSSKPAS